MAEKTQVSLQLNVGNRLADAKSGYRIRMVRGEAGSIEVVAKLLDGGDPFDATGLSVRFVAVLAGGKSVADPVPASGVSGDTVAYTLPSGVGATPGDTRAAMFELSSGDDYRIYTEPFVVSVGDGPSPTSGDIGSYIPELDALISQLKEAVAAEAERETAENARKEAEGKRETAENAREAKSAKAVSDANAAAEKALQAAYHYPVWDDAKGEFSNESIKAWLAWNNDGKLYGADQPLDEVQTCDKVLANAGIPNPVPSTLAQVGSDPYFGVGPFRWYHVNGYVDDDGTQHVTGIKEFGHFSYTDGRDVLQLTPVRYVSHGFVGGKYRTVNSDTPQEGLVPEERSELPGGGTAPYMLRAAFPAGLVDGKPVSRPGVRLWTRTCSHNSINGKAKLKGAAYSGLTAADLDYLYDMFLLKYADKSSQSVFAGCTSHNVQSFVTAATEGASSVVVAKATADKIPVGSAVMVGTTAVAGRDRGNADAYDLADQATVVSKEAVDESNTRLVLDCDPFTSAVGQLVSTAPWNPGGTLGIVYDGSPTSNTSGREPFVLQGIECMVGAYEWLGDALVKNAGDGWKAYLSPDTQKSSTDVTADYAEIYAYADKDADSWGYPMAQVKSGGVYMARGLGASTTTGTGDGTYYLKSATTGTMGFRAFGYLGNGGYAGLRCADLDRRPDGTGWGGASRLSCNGRNGVNPAQRPQAA